MNRLTVKTGKSCDIITESGFGSLLPELTRALGANRGVFIITDDNVSPIYGGALLQALKGAYEKVFLLAVAPGEKSKSLETLSRVYSFLLDNSADRGSALIALGGGVIGDLTGFAAATYMRGISYVQIPTTLLSMVDSSVGGKTAVDFSGYKNIIGAFYQPDLVYINPEALSTLPAREFSCGMAEVIKYGVIADSEFYRFLASNIDCVRESETLKRIISRCVELKAEIVERDERDEGIREILNFGHTFGHAVEALSALNHGECVALGMRAAFALSCLRGNLAPKDAEAFDVLLTRLNLPLFTDIEPKALYSAMSKDKKSKSGKITYILPERIGYARGVKNVTQKEALYALRSITKGE